MTLVTEQPPGGDPDGRPPRPGNRRRAGRVEVAVRIGLVVALLAVAAQGLTGRRHLDWDALAADPGSAWGGVLLVGAAAFVLVSSFRALITMLRFGREGDDGESPDDERRKLPWWGQLLMAAAVIGALLLVYWLVRSAVHLPMPLHEQGDLRNDGPPPTGDLARPSSGPALLAAVVVGAALAIALAVLRSRRPPAVEDDFDEGSGDQDAALAQAVAAAEEELDAHGDDTRAAIIAAYLAMERQLRGAGADRHPSDTPTDFLLRAMTAAHVSRPAATRLTDLFREARYSTHPMPSSARDEAARALARVADDVTSRRG